MFAPGGSFTTLNGIRYNNVAYYDLKEQSFKAMENGTNDEVKVLTTDSYGNVYIGGAFTQVGTKKSGPLAVWNVYHSKWVDTGLSSSDFTPGSVVTAISTECTNSYDFDSTQGLFPCDIYIAGNFKASVSGSNATNILYYNNKNKRWETQATLNTTYITVISKVVNNNMVFYGGKFHDANGKEYGLAMYDTSSSSWIMIDGVSGVTDIYYNSHIYSSDNMFISASIFAYSQCKGICNFNLRDGSWTTRSGIISTGSVNKIRYINGLSASNVGSIFVGGSIMSESSVGRRDGTGEYSAISTNYPKETVLGMDICGLKAYDVTGCKAGSVAVGGQNFFKFYDANDNMWKSLLSENGFVLNSISITPEMPIPSPIPSPFPSSVPAKISSSECNSFKVVLFITFLFIFHLIN